MTEGRRVLEVLGRSAGGIARHVARVVDDLKDRDGLTIGVAGPADLPVEMPVAVAPVEIPDGPLRGHRRAVGSLAKLVTEGGYGVVHAHGLRAGIDAAMAARRADRRPTVIVTVHNVVLPATAGRLRTLVYRRAESLVVRLSDRVFAASREIAGRLRGRGAGAKIEVLHLGVDPPAESIRSRTDVRAELRVEADAPLVVCVARLHPQKSLDVLLRALADLPNDVVLAIVGDGPLRPELERLTVELGLAARTRWLGYRPDATEIIAAGDVFCLSSVWEACALAAQEAMHLGVPVVSTAVGGMPELIEDRRSGRLVPAGDASGLAAAIAEVLASPSDRRRYAARGLEIVHERFSTTAMIDRLEAAYRGA